MNDAPAAEPLPLAQVIDDLMRVTLELARVIQPVDIDVYKAILRLTAEANRRGMKL